MKSIAEKFDCPIVMKPGYGLSFSGTERQKRLFLLYMDKIAHRMRAMHDTVERDVHLIDKERYNISRIENTLIDAFGRHRIQIAYIYLTKLKLYIILSEMRLDSYQALFFSESEMRYLQNSEMYQIAQDIAKQLRTEGYSMKEKDVLMFEALLLGYQTRRQPDSDDYESRRLAEAMTGYIENLYKGVGQYFDAAFAEDMSAHMSGMWARLRFQLPIDEESIFQVKQDGAFTSEVCRDIAEYIEGQCHIRLPKAEILSFYYIVNNALIRYEKREARYKAVLISRYGVYYAKNVINRIMQEYGREFFWIEPMEFTELAQTDMQQYHFIITDIEQERFDFLDIPLMTIDFYRNPEQSRSLNHFLAILAEEELRHIIKNENLYRNIELRRKEDAFAVFAEYYVGAEQRQEFVQACIYKNAMLTDERCNRLAVVSVDSKYYAKKEVVIVLSAAAFLWDEEPVSIVLFLNQRHRNYMDLKAFNLILSTFLHANINLPKKIMELDADGTIDLIVREQYHI